MALTLRCTCGRVEGTVEDGHAYTRATCYCRDCQAYAHWIGKHGTLDAHGGTDIVAMDPRQVCITSGLDHVACMSLSPKGILRWYADCCRTPLANTPRDAKTAYVGLIGPSLAPPQAVDAAFGPAGRTVLNTGSATGKVKPTPFAFLRDGLRIFRGVLGARLRKQPPTLFFDPDGKPTRTPHVLHAAQRKAL